MNKLITKLAHFAPFDGDGRKTVKPDADDALEYCHPIPVRASTARMLIQMAQRKPSNHSRQGATVWVIVCWAKFQGVNWCVKHHWVNGEVAGHTVTLEGVRP